MLREYPDFQEILQNYGVIENSRTNYHENQIREDHESNERSDNSRNHIMMGNVQQFNSTITE